MGAATLADVAARAGVSVATASRALSGSRPVAPDKRRRVLEASRALGYQPNAVASALRASRTRTVGLLLPRYSTLFLSALIEAVSTSLDDHDVALVLRHADPDEAFDTHVRALRARRVDGIVLSAPSIEAGRAAVAGAGDVPVVQVGRFVDPDATDSVGLDEDRATGLLSDHLAAGGARHALAVGLDPATPADRRRLAALRTAGEQARLSLRVAAFDGSDLNGGIRAGERLVAQGFSGHDSIVAANDEVAAGLMAVLRLNAVRVPGDVQVASLLDLTPGARTHAVTTLRHPWPAMGREAVRLLQQPRRPEDDVARRVQLAPALVIAPSTRSPETVSAQEKS
ncbi:LacI family DNA-binding transcriptional regulator [Kineosporia sp. J2-2]|uniref:LacI family DNA-binding transcriptional regulator n=1 Tax=Kineosporia corallincola TaxID=2835133 RepID=A0ABS5TED6_9ACTN|nr:LacI family DNA-binding transcriptional regulator [Kineosporia corallincola]MBT0768463.1 LacI family DNA-binding transcriptional regulator [Kineosporia corallincola]